MTTSATTARPRPTLTVLRAARLFDGTGALPDPTVIIDGAVILAAGRGLPVPDGAHVIDLPGATILPGLVDGHVTLVFDASPASGAQGGWRLGAEPLPPQPRTGHHATSVHELSAAAGRRQ